MNSLFIKVPLKRAFFVFNLFISIVVSSDVTAKTFTVTTTADSGKGSLRKAITRANKSGCRSLITFELTTSDDGYDHRNNSWCIKPCDELPEIVVPLTINGFSQEGSCPNRHAIDQENSADIKIELSGTRLKRSEAHGLFQASLHQVGLRFGKGSNCSRVKGIAINSFHYGIIVESDEVRITGTFLGVDLDGITPKPNTVSVLIEPTACKALIGGCKPQHRNLISGTGQLPSTKEIKPENQLLGTITIFGNDTSIQGSTINLTRKGDALVLHDALFGIVSINNQGTSLGGSHTVSRIVSAGHQEANIFCDTTSNDYFENVFAGTSLDGARALGGGCGLKIVGNQATTTTHRNSETDYNHTIKRSVFSGNKTNGILLGQQGDSTPLDSTHIINTYVGTDLTGTVALPNGADGIVLDYTATTRIEKSTIKHNTHNGIHLIRALTTFIEESDIDHNGLFGVQIEPVTGTRRVRDAGEYEVKLINVTAQGNGGNGISTPCGSIKQL